MPIVHVHMVVGRSIEQKRSLVEKITATLTETINVNEENVHIILHESPAENASTGGVLLFDARKAAAASA